MDWDPAKKLPSTQDGVFGFEVGGVRQTSR